MHTGRACQISPIARKQAALGAYAGLGLRGNARTLGTLGMTGTAGGAVKGASTGAAIGSYVPVIGTVIGALGGAIGGAIAGSLGKKDPEQYNFDAAVQLWQGNRLAVLNLANKYLPIAGLFDLHLKGPHIPIYLKYGRMGEERFVHDLALLVYQAAQSGQITAADTPQTVMVKVVQPWIDSWGFGPMNDPHQDLINLLIMGMIADYVDGSAPQAWRSIGGGLPASFAQIPPFSLPGGTTAAPAAQFASGTAVAAAPISQVTTPVAPAGGGSRSVAAQPTFPGWATGLPNADPRLTVSWAESENNWSATWVPMSTPGFFSANYPGGPSQLQVAIGTDGQIRALRIDAGQGWGQYTGAFAPDGVSFSGTVVYYAPTGAVQNYPFAGRVSGTPAVTAPVAPITTTQPTITTPSGTTVAIPAGFTLVGAANGLQAYAGLDGNYYAWSGTAMSPLTGTLVGLNGQTAQIVNGQLQPQSAVAQLPLSAQSVYTGPSYATSSPQSIPSYTNAPTGAAVPAITSTPQVAAAGLTGPAWVGIAALGVLGWMLLSGKTGVREHPARSAA